MNKIIKITITEEQQLWLLKRLKIDWDEEVNYQLSNGERDTEYLEQLFECYKAILGNPQQKGLIGFAEAMANKEILEGMLKEIEEIKEEPQI